MVDFTDTQAFQIRLICKVAKSPEQVITKLKDIVVKETKSYIDISALDRNQISGSGISLTPFRELSIDAITKNVSVPAGYNKYDKDLYYHDSGIIGEKRYIVCFNPILFIEDRTNRKEKIKYFKNYLNNGTYCFLSMK